MGPEVIAALFAVAPPGGNRSRLLAGWLTAAGPILWIIGGIFVAKWADDTVAMITGEEFAAASAVDINRTQALLRHLEVDTWDELSYIECGNERGCADVSIRWGRHGERPLNLSALAPALRAGLN